MIFQVHIDQVDLKYFLQIMLMLSETLLRSKTLLLLLKRGGGWFQESESLLNKENQFEG